MSSDKVSKLVESLLKRTVGGTAEWVPGPREDTFVWSGTAASVVLLTADNDGRAPFVVRITDAEGRVIEDEIYGPTDLGIRAVRELYAAARSKALNIEATLDALLGELGDS